MHTEIYYINIITTGGLSKLCCQWSQVVCVCCIKVYGLAKGFPKNRRQSFFFEWQGFATVASAGELTSIYTRCDGWFASPFGKYKEYKYYSLCLPLDIEHSFFFSSKSLIHLSFALHLHWKGTKAMCTKQWTSVDWDHEKARQGQEEKWRTYWCIYS